LVAASLLLIPSFEWHVAGVGVPVLDVAGIALFGTLAVTNFMRRTAADETQAGARA
jgi:hypothetical protein